MTLGLGGLRFRLSVRVSSGGVFSSVGVVMGKGGIARTTCKKGGRSSIEPLLPRRTQMSTRNQWRLDVDVNPHPPRNALYPHFACRTPKWAGSATCGLAAGDTDGPDANVQVPRGQRSHVLAL